MNFFNTNIQYLLSSFIIYSILGWIVESIYMSLCNRKLTNRGFCKGPFCPIYGFGATIGYAILSPLGNHYLLIYFLGAFLATIFEFIVGKLMIKFLGALWWDYNDKPFNYKGIICLESTLAWGFYALCIVFILNDYVINIVSKFSSDFSLKIIGLIFMLVFIDYGFKFRELYYRHKNTDELEDDDINFNLN